MSEPCIRWTMAAQRARLLRDLLGAVESGRSAIGWQAVAQSLLGELQRAIESAGAPELGRRARWLCKRAERRSGKAAEPPALPFAKPDPLDRERKRQEKRAQKARRTMEVYDAVRLRAGGMCEDGCGRHFHDGPMRDSAPEMDDFFGGAKHRNSRECWMLRAECHRDKTNNRPSRDEWLARFISHCRKYGLDRERHRAQAKLDSREDVARAAEVSRVLR